MPSRSKIRRVLTINAYRKMVQQYFFVPSADTTGNGDAEDGGDQHTNAFFVGDPAAAVANQVTGTRVASSAVVRPVARPVVHPAAAARIVPSACPAVANPVVGAPIAPAFRVAVSAGPAAANVVPVAAPAAAPAAAAFASAFPAI